jgi:hypothetical protein
MFPIFYPIICGERADIDELSHNTRAGPANMQVSGRCDVSKGWELGCIGWGRRVMGEYSGTWTRWMGISIILF